MSNQIDCNACDELRQNNPEFVQNGVTDAVCNSMKNDTGIKTSVGNNDCEDLNTANDCLVGRMDGDLEAYDTCDWKKFMHKFIPNLYTLQKLMICALCGIWANIHSLWSRLIALENLVGQIQTSLNNAWGQINNIVPSLNRAWCYINNMLAPKAYAVHAFVDDDPDKAPINGFRIARGIHVRESGVPLQLVINNNLMRISGSLTFDGHMPTSYTNGAEVEWLDFFDGSSEITTANGDGSYHGNPPNGGLFLYEYQINPCDYGFEDMWPAHLFASWAGDFLCKAVMYKPGDQYYYDCGYGPNGSMQTYNPSNPNLRLIQVRLINMRTWGTTRNNGKITPNGITGVKPCKESWSC